MKRLLVLGIVGLVGSGAARPAPAPASWGFDDVATFEVRWRGLITSRRLNPLFAMPGEVVGLAVEGPGSYTLTAEAGSVEARGTANWGWRAPTRAGPVMLTIRASDGDSVRFQAIVMVPASEIRNGRLRGYRIDAYPVGDGSARRPRAPLGFIEVTPENRGLRISNRLRLGQFLCKQESGWPKYVVISERLVWRLEQLADGLAARGLPATLTLMSAYRTPFYNARLGNVRTSRHVYGQAADVYVDVRPADGDMDDLNGDGRVDRRDANRLAELVDEILGDGSEFRGGVGRYGRNASHGPFVHIDVRGYRARW